MSRAPAIGIDLGTSYSCVSVLKNGKAEIIPNDFGKRATPSYVSFTEYERFIGDEAKNQINRNPQNTIFDINRLIGKNFYEKDIQKDLELWPFKVVKDSKSDRPQIQIVWKKKEKKFFIEEILAMVLQKLKQVASNYLGKEVRDAVITVPSYFYNFQRDIIGDAALIAGLNPLRLISSSDAAAISYNFDKTEKKENILIFDLGGGSLGLSVIILEDECLDVKAVNGDNHFGGEDFTNRLAEYCIDEFKKKTSIDIKSNAKALARVRTSCEKAKILLSNTLKTIIDIEALMDDEDLNIVITRDKFEDLCLDLFQRCIPPLENVIKDSKIKKSKINEIILTGGSSRIPKIQQMVQNFFKGKVLNKSINPDEASAKGAAIYAAVITNARDEKIENLIILEVIPFSIGIETIGGAMKILIPKNSTIPTTKFQNLSTYSDNQTSFIVKVYEGENKLTKDNYLLGQLILEDIPPMPRGKPQIEISIDIDSYRNIYVRGIEKSTGKEKVINITYDKQRLNREDIDRFIEEAQKFKDEDNEIKERIEVKNSLEQYCYNVKQTINDNKMKDKFYDGDKKKILTKVDDILKWLNDNPNSSKDEYNAKFRELEALIQKCKIIS